MAGALRTLTFVSALSAVSAMSALAACSPVSRFHDVAYYRAHRPERASEMAACRNDRAATPNCINALAADSEAESGRFWTVKTPTPRVGSNTL